MAHWAEIDENSIVIRITVGDNNEPDEGYAWLIDNLGGTWVKTSFNGTIRKNFAGIGFIYDPILDAFYTTQPYPSWILNEDICQWEAPVAHPAFDEADPKFYIWDEATTSWVEAIS
jgi:hypothetical protein